MSKIYDGPTEISSYVKVNKQNDSIKVVSRLLDGSEHVQIIGQPTTRLEVEIIVDLAGREAIDTIDATGASIKVVDEGNTYDGIIISKGSWDKITNELVKNSLVISVEVV